MGVPHDTAEQFRRAMESSGALGHTVLFLNLADEPGMQRLLTPRYALTAAEYLAFVEGRHVLVILTDMPATARHCAVSASHGGSRRGYPGTCPTSPAVRTRQLHPRPARTLTQLPILTMPGDDIGHPIPDLTGHHRGQIVLDRELDRRGIYPPIRVLPSLSRLMDAGTGEGYTDVDHPALAHQLFAAYARAVRVRTLASVMGEQGLPENDRKFLAFGLRFEEQFLNQATSRTLEESMEAGWSALRGLPRTELSRLSDAQIKRTSPRRPMPGWAETPPRGSRSGTQGRRRLIRKATSCSTKRMRSPRRS
jgi:V/A-type H+-transporting ATPase subunit B